MTTARQLRKAALSLGEVEESARSEETAYLVHGAVFASMPTGAERAELSLTAADVDTLLAVHPTAERVLRGERLIGASIALADIDGQQLNHWVRRAWKHRAPKHLVAAAEAAERAEPGSGGLPRAIGRPATRALAEAGITSLDELAHLSEAELSSLHGVGPKAVAILREARAAHR